MFSQKSRTLENNHLGGSRFGRHTSNMSVIPHHTRTWWKAIGANFHKTSLCRLVNLSRQIQSCFLTSHKMRTFQTSFSLNLVSHRSQDFGSTCLGRRSCVGPFQSGSSRFQTGYGHAWLLVFVKPQKRRPADVDGHFRPAEPQHEGMPIRMLSRRHHTQLLDSRPGIPRDHEVLSFFELITINNALPAKKCDSRFCERVPRPTTGSSEGVNAVFCADWKDTFSPRLVMRERSLYAELPSQQRI